MIKKIFCFLMIFQNYFNINSFNSYCSGYQSNEEVLLKKEFFDEHKMLLTLIATDLNKLLLSSENVEKNIQKYSEDLDEDRAERAIQTDFINQKIDEINDFFFKMTNSNEEMLKNFDAKFKDFALDNKNFQNIFNGKVDSLATKIAGISSKTEEMNNKFIEFNTRNENLKGPIDTIINKTNDLDNKISIIIECLLNQNNNLNQHCCLNDKNEECINQNNMLICHQNNYSNKSRMNQYLYQEVSLVNILKKAKEKGK